MPEGKALSMHMSIHVQLNVQCAAIAGVDDASGV